MTPTTPSVVEDSMGVPIVEATSNDDEKSLWIPQQELEKDDDDDDDNTLAETDETGGKAVSEDMPLWYYQRIEPPPPPKNDGIKTTTVAVVYRTAMVLGKVVLNETTTIPLSSSSSTPRIAAIAPSDDIATPMPHPGQEIPIHPQWTNAPVYIVVSGYSDGSVTIVEASTGRNVLPTTPGSNAGINNSNTNSTTPRDETNQKTDFACLWMGGDDRSNHSSNTTATSSAIVAVSVDSSGTVIAAMDAAGNVSVWTVQYQLLYRPDESSSMGSTITTTDTTTATGVAPERAQQQAASIAAAAAVEAGGGGNLFAKLFWNRSPMSPPPPSSATIPPTTESTTQESSTSATAAANNSQYLVPTLTMVMCEPHFKVQRLAYSKADFGGTPTCFCLDPAYKAPPQSSFVSSNNNNKSASLQQQQQQQLQQQMIVAFDTGKIVLSGRSGGTWRMRLDHITLPYTGPPIHDPDWRGIETMVWRGNLLAFADCSGVKLFDTLTLAPVAHVDRPIGARPSLYPSTQFQVSPHLCFETSRQLLVAWGDCLLTLTVSNALTGTSDTAASTTSIASGTAPLTTSNSSLTATDQSSSSIALRKQRSVSCTMAWGLDCIAAGVVPIDARHVAILGRRIDLLRDDHAGNEGDEEDDGVELQVLDRSNGFVVYSDLLQLEQLPETYQGIEPKESKVRALSERYALLSTFAVPRMGDAAESKLDSFDSTSFRESKRSFVDEHVQWSMENVSFSFADDRSGLEDDDANSVDSDDYSFFVRSSDNLKTMAELSADVSTLAPSPFLVVASATDSVSARMRNVDDAINFALRQKKCALALRLALPFIRQLRCHKINDLVHSYLRAVLRLVDADGTMGIVSTRNEEVKRRRHLSLRRMKLAAEMLPILLGGNSEMWETWISELEQIPGALFVVRSTLPVRGQLICGICLIVWEFVLTHLYLQTPSSQSMYTLVFCVRC